MSALPNAVPQEPACGACCGDTYFDGDTYTCEDCQLCFAPNHNLDASFIDPAAEPCGTACDNFWHGDHKAKQGYGYDCGTCKLPSGHKSFHWTGCRIKAVEVAS